MQTTMHSLQEFLLTFILVITPTVYAFLLNDHGNVSAGHPDHDNYNIYSKIDALEKNLQIMETSLQEKTTHMDTLSRQVLLTVNEMDAKIETSDFRNKTLEIDQYYDFLKNAGGNPIGFTARLNGTYSSKSSHIRGHEIIFNLGNAYNGTDFTCPSPGLYLFLVTLITTDINNGVWIYKNSVQLTLAWSGADPQNNGASAFAVIWLDPPDHVYLLPHSTLHVEGRSVFSGVKIH